MLTLHPEFVIDKGAKKKAVLVPFAEWRHLMEAIEELEDIRAYDKAKSHQDASVPFEQAVQEIKAKAKR